MTIEKIKSFLFENLSTRQTVAKNTFWLTVSSFGGRFIRAAIIVYAARVLGAEGWGVFSYAISLVAFLTIFVDIGIGPILSREVARTGDEERRTRLLATSFFIKSVLLVLAFVVVMFVAPQFATVPGAKAILPIVAFILVFDTFRELGFAFTRALERMEIETGIFLFTNVAIVAFGFFFLSLERSVASFSYGYAAGTALGMIATFVVLRGYYKKILSHFSRDLILPILRSAWPLAISSFLGIFLVNTDILIIGAFRPAEDVGYYAAAYRIIQLLYAVPVILAWTVLPAFSRFAHKEPEKMRHAVQETVGMVFLVALPLAVGGIITAPHLISLLFGSEYLPGTSSFQVLLLTLLFDFPAAILNYAAFAYDRQKNLAVYSAIGAGSNVFLDLVFIPRFGILGSAWATLIAQALSNGYLWYTVRRIRPFSVAHYFPKLAAATAGMGIFVWLLTLAGIPVLITVALGATAYLAALHYLKEPLLHEARGVLAHGIS